MWIQGEGFIIYLQISKIQWYGFEEYIYLQGLQTRQVLKYFGIKEGDFIVIQVSKKTLFEPYYFFHTLSCSYFYLLILDYI